MTGDRQRTDRYGNAYAPGLPYARGEVIGSTGDDVVKLRHAWRLIGSRADAEGRDKLYNFSGLERRFEAAPEDLAVLDDELAPAFYGERLRALALDHMGGNATDHDFMLFNRQTAAILTAMLVMAKPGDTVVGVSPRYSHPCVVRAAARAGATFVDTTGLPAFKAALDAAENVSVVALTRLAVSYEIMSEPEIREAVRLAHARGAKVLVDDAGGARVGPAVFDQPKPMAFGFDVASTGLDKYGTIGPRLGLLSGDAALVAQIRATAFELGCEARPMLYPAVVRSLEQYDPQRVRDLVATTKTVALELKKRFGNRVTETPVTAQLLGEDILEIACERAGLSSLPVKPIEATAALAMLLVRDHGILTVHLAGLPPGTSAMLIKFVPPETLERFGGAKRLTDAIDDSLTKLAAVIGDPEEFRALVLGAPEAVAA